MSTFCLYCKLDTPIYRDGFHIRDVRDERKILGTPDKFCSAFYHVSRGGNLLLCLDRPSCIVQGEPKTAVALVKYEKEGGDPPLVKRYTNCPHRDNRKHAEEFFSHDINPRISTDKELIDAIYGGRITKITMFITMQPCHLSTKDTKGTYDDQSCCKIIAEALVDLPNDIKICIKPTHLLKAGYNKKVDPKTTEERADNLCIDNAEKGIKELMRIGERIEVSAMKRNDWFFLLGFVNLESYPNIAFNAVSKRIVLDKEIDAKLECMKYALDWEKAFLNESVDNGDDAEHIFKALSEMPNCNKNAKIPHFDLNAAIENFDLKVELNNQWDAMKHVKRNFGYLGDKNNKNQSKYTFVFEKVNAKISWEKIPGIWEKAELGSGGASEGPSGRACEGPSEEPNGGPGRGRGEGGRGRGGRGRGGRGRATGGATSRGEGEASNG